MLPGTGRLAVREGKDDAHAAAARVRGAGETGSRQLDGKGGGGGGQSTQGQRRGGEATSVCAEVRGSRGRQKQPFLEFLRETLTSARAELGLWINWPKWKQCSRGLLTEWGPVPTSVHGAGPQAYTAKAQTTASGRRDPGRKPAREMELRVS